MNLTRRIQGYIKQMDILHKKGNPLFYNTYERLTALDKLKTLLLYDSINPKVVLLNKDNLRLCLPHSSNKSYETTRKNLLAAINHSENLLKNETPLLTKTTSFSQN